MPSIKDLKKRIGTVKNTQQTTRAMKMVSAAKLRRAQEAIQSQRPYARAVQDLIRDLWQHSSETLSASQYPILRQDPAGSVKKVLGVVVTSDRGLCGGFNSSVIKASQRWLNAVHTQPGVEAELAFVGRKGYEFFRHRKVKVGSYHPELGGKVIFAKAQGLANILVHKFLNHEVDEVYFIYNEFKNAATQKVVTEQFLPLRADLSSESKDKVSQFSPAYLVKPGVREVLAELLNKNFAIQSFRILLESQAGEHGARMSAMENATKNAGEMIRKLTLQYNKQRQAGITKELLEIIAGSESQKG